MSQVLQKTKAGVITDVSNEIYEGFFRNDSELLKLLVLVRGSVLQSDEKMELRDLILEYSQIAEPEKKGIVKLQIIKSLKAKENFVVLTKANKGKENSDQSATPVIVENKISVASQTSLGIARPTPSFVSQNKTVKEVLKEAVPEVLTPESKIVAEVVSTPSEKSQEPVIIVNVPGRETSAPHVANPTERINEIKRLINSKVGNPVNLINSNNSLGREYMNALLDAMKKSSGSAPAGELDVAMAKLETAYSAVINTLPQGGVVVAKKEPELVPVAKIEPPKIEPEKSQTVHTVPEVVEKTEVSLPSQKTIIKEDKPVSVEVKPIVEAPPQSNKERVDLSKKHLGLFHQPEEDVLDISHDLSNVRPVSLQTLKDSLLSRKPEKKIESEVKTVLPQPKAEPLPKKEAVPKVEQKNAIKKLSPVSETTTLPEKMNKLENELKKKEENKKTPLSGLDAPEIGQGLSQLLSEWKLFKRSGFLGTGPNGSEHPLYKKIAKLPMAAVIAGRFEGATPGIKQSITDYMNGWRYEQGLVHEMGETFEHYLRRVILHIIERQKTSPTA